MFEILNTFYDVIAPISLIVLGGYLLTYLFTIDTRSLSRVVIYLAGPALVYDGLSKSSLNTSEIGQLMLHSILAMGSIALFSWFLARMLKRSQQITSAFALSSTLINSGNFGLPMALFAFGEAGLSPAIIIFVAHTILANSLGVFLASRGSGSVKDALLNMFKVPLPYAAGLGFAVNYWQVSVPVPIERGMTILGEAAVPVMLVLLGIQLSRTSITRELKWVSLATGVRLIGGPVLAFAFVKLLGIEGLNAQIALLQFSMPTAVTSVVLAEEFGSDVGFTSSTLLVSTFLSLITLSLLLAFMPAF